MTNMRDLLGKLMESDVVRSAKARVEHALGSGGLGKPDGTLSDLVSGLGSGAQSTLETLQQQAGALYGQTRDAVKAGSPVAIGGLAAIAGAVLGGGGAAVRGAVGAGLLALLGSVAYRALKKGDGESAQTRQPPASLRAPATPAEEAVLEDEARLMILAMINAAKADGEIDAEERSRIIARLKDGGGTEADIAFVEAEMAKPMDTAPLVAGAKTSELAAQMYAASVLAIEIDTEAERTYLQQLASALGLDAAVVADIHRTLGAPPLPA